ncbi:MAG: hypothetical protein M3375_02315 [Actinomycetota bacterium]|nr:hypothetical protein [Actinomycetota bacterium]
MGPRGVGKTTLLRQLQRTLRDSGARIAFVDAAAVAEVVDLASRIRDALLGQPASASSGASAAVEVFRSDPAPVAGASRALANLLRSIGEAEPTTLLLDGSGSAESVYALFGRMRDVLWQQEHRWVVSIDEGDRATALRPPADAFFDVVLTLEPWSLNDLVALLMRRADDESPLERDLVISAAAGANGSPREALRALADAVVNDRDPGELLSKRARLLDDASRLGRAPGTLMAELLDRGEASPSDELLQATLGVTRSRLTQLFRELLNAKLVVAETERTGGPGRPRTIYRPALPS